MGANSAQYIHHVIEAIKLGFVDTTWYCADSSKVEVPLDWLLSKDYATKRRSLINTKKYVHLYDYCICRYLYNILDKVVTSNSVVTCIYSFWICTSRIVLYFFVYLERPSHDNK